MRYFLRGTGCPYTPEGGYPSLEEAQAMAAVLDSEGSGWEFDLVDQDGAIVEHHLGY